jgi:hypothetical protein
MDRQMLMSGCWILSDAPLRASRHDDMEVSGGFSEKIRRDLI